MYYYNSKHNYNFKLTKLSEVQVLIALPVFRDFTFKTTGKDIKSGVFLFVYCLYYHIYYKQFSTGCNLIVHLPMHPGRVCCSIPWVKNISKESPIGQWVLGTTLSSEVIVPNLLCDVMGDSSTSIWDPENTQYGTLWGKNRVSPNDCKMITT